MSKKALKILSFVILGLSGVSLIGGIIFHFGRSQQTDVNLYQFSLVMGIVCLILALVLLAAFLVLYYLSNKKK